MAEPLLAIYNVSKRFGGLRAVDAASLFAEEGRITALIGPNGAGKTTLFAMIAGFLQADAGEIHYTGRDITEGGTAIPYWMEDPHLRQEYEERLKAEGVENRMRPEYYERDYRGLLPQE